MWLSIKPIISVAQPGIALSWRGVSTAYSLGSHSPRGFMGGRVAAWAGDSIITRRKVIWARERSNTEEAILCLCGWKLCVSECMTVCKACVCFSKHPCMRGETYVAHMCSESRNALKIHSVGETWWALGSAPVRTSWYKSEGKTYLCNQVNWWDLSDWWRGERWTYCLIDP